MEKFWPGGVTIIFRAHPDVSWDLGETEGTVAVRMPNNAVALELLSHTGPLAVSSGNRSGGPSAKSINEVWDQLGERVSVYLDGGLVGEMYAGSADNPGSTIVDASAVPKGGPWRVIRSGVVPPEAIFDVAQGEWEL
jgi:tRNA threonylcarbamoyl adenosine modification protein (Sua5/YciO/YrdC/YwlC family)